MAAELSIGDIEGFAHVRIVIGLVTGLSVTRLLAGLSRFVQHPGRNPIYSAHFIWVIFMLLYVTHFWWFQFGLVQIDRWEYPEYAFIIFYAALIYFIASLLFPEQMNEYSGYKDYFQSRARWFYGLLTAMFLVDIVDSLAKGLDHFYAMGPYYPMRQCALAGLAFIGIFVKKPAYHIGFGLFAIAVQIWWISVRFLLLD